MDNLFPLPSHGTGRERCRRGSVAGSGSARQCRGFGARAGKSNPEPRLAGEAGGRGRCMHSEWMAGQTLVKGPTRSNSGIASKAEGHMMQSRLSPVHNLASSMQAGARRGI